MNNHHDDSDDIHGLCFHDEGYGDDGSTQKLFTDDYPQSLEAELLIPDSSNDITADIMPVEDVDTMVEENDNNTSINSGELLYAGSSLTTSSSSVLVLKYKLRHGLTEAALSDLLQLLRLHCPQPNHLPSSIYYYKKHFSDMQYPVIMHKFCSECTHGLGNLSEQQSVCPNVYCSADLSSLGSVSSFIEIPIEVQIKSILER